MPDDHTDDSETRATARLPGLDIEILHRRSPDGDAEQISINLRATPSFEAFGGFLESANPFAFWARAMQLAWSPWPAPPACWPPPPPPAKRCQNRPIRRSKPDSQTRLVRLHRKSRGTTGNADAA